MHDALVAQYGKDYTQTTANVASLPKQVPELQIHKFIAIKTSVEFEWKDHWQWKLKVIEWLARGAWHLGLDDLARKYPDSVTL